MLAEDIPSQEETLQKVGPLLKAKGQDFFKFKRAFVRPAKPNESISTILNGQLETTNVAKEGDWIVRADTTDGEQYILTPQKFEALYEPAALPIENHPQKVMLEAQGFNAYAPKKSAVRCIEVTHEILDIFPNKQFIAAWGQPMLVQIDDILAGKMDPDGNLLEVYRIEKNAFAETYKVGDMA
eukprot:gnl/MRDRNA2_/MRDRNA2_95332_c0_seq1.p1 gnl/MRDRNA2_/MRDRNA2_95332_c0~~gnl/MRDRNA2_/MRDRNA2_95332_c0_seq1.p1  ORF type:complete len:183 (+),score=33.35 gnl/MRDRNA2_/MRDRNA2_95332_c0_seq1:52-600(+)